MFTKYKTWFFIEALIIVTITGINFYGKNQNMTLKRELEDTQYTKSLYQMLLTNFRLQFQSEDLELPQNLSFENLEGSKLNSTDFINHYTKIVYRFSPLHCQECIDDGLNSLIKAGTKIGYDNIVILTSFHEKRDLFVFKESIKDYNFEVLNVNPKDFDIPIDRCSMPYMFILDDHNLVKNVFIPSKAMPDRTERYLSIILEKYFHLCLEEQDPH